MRVKDLIEKLQEYDPEQLVCVSADAEGEKPGQSCSPACVGVTLYTCDHLDADHKLLERDLDVVLIFGSLYPMRRSPAWVSPETGASLTADGRIAPMEEEP